MNYSQGCNPYKSTGRVKIPIPGHTFNPGDSYCLVFKCEYVNIEYIYILNTCTHTFYIRSLNIFVFEDQNNTLREKNG